MIPWKPLLFCLLALALPGLLRSQDSLRIDSVGFEDYYSNAAPTPVRVHIPAATHAQSIELEFIVRSGNNFLQREISRRDRFAEHVEAAAGQPLEIEAPILIPQANWSELEVTASTADGQPIASVHRDLKDLMSIVNGSYLVAVYCTDDPTCRTVQSQIAFGKNGGSGAQMNPNLRLTTFSDPRAEWWAYRAAQTVVLAGPISRFSSAERQALENFTRSGGTLAVVEDLAADNDFLAAYRQGAPNLVAMRVGRGHLLRARSVGSEDLGRLFAGGMALHPQREAPSIPPQDSADPFLTRIGVSFAFPRFRWLTIWLTVYLLVVGPLNFAILRRIKRLEWGWASVCALAMLFTLGFYFSGSARRPKNYTVDNATIYSLDDRSPMAVEYVGLRASSPQRGDVRISMNDPVLVMASSDYRYSQAQGDGDEGVDIGASMTDKARIQKGWDLELGTPLIIKTPMLRWSFQDWGFEGFHKFPGTVHWTSSNKLKNETGVSFRQAVYFDFSANKQYLLSQVAAGQEIDLAAATASDIWVRKQISSNQSQEVLRYQETLALDTSHRDVPFSPEELPSWNVPSPREGHMFAGLSDEPIPGADLQPAAVHRSAMALTIVYLDEK